MKAVHARWAAGWRHPAWREMELQRVPGADPILPIRDGLRGLFIDVNALDLIQGNGEGALLPDDHHEHPVIALRDGRHLLDLVD